MSSVYPKLPRASVRDSFDEDDLSDVDDEVFIRDGKNGGLKLDEDRGVKRPLMAPRRKTKNGKSHGNPKLPYRALLAPFFYGSLALVVLLGLIVACIYTVNLFPIPINILKQWMYGVDSDKISDPLKIVPCTSLASSVIWTRTLPKLTSEAPFRSVDVNGDKIEDIVIGFGTGGYSKFDAVTYFCGKTFCYKLSPMSIHKISL